MEQALLWFDKEIILSEAFEHYSDMFSVLFLVLRKDENVIEVYYDK